MADEPIEVHVWTNEDGAVIGVGRLLSADRRVELIPTEGQSVTTARVSPDLLDSTRRLKLNRDTGEFEAAE